MVTQQKLRINSPLVVSQEIEGEAILIHFDSGSYYSANATGSIILDLVDRGRTGAEVCTELAAIYPDAGAELAGSVESFLAEAQREGLLVPATADALVEALASASDRPGPAGPFTAPKLERFDDLQDLLMLDPIHDVDAVGWPVPPPEGDAPAARGQER